MFNVQSGLQPLVSFVSSLNPLQKSFLIARLMHFSLRQNISKFICLINFRLMFKMFLRPVVYVDSQGPNMAAIHVVPECEAVSSGGRLEHVTDQEGQVSPLTH